MKFHAGLRLLFGAVLVTAPFLNAQTASFVPFDQFISTVRTIDSSAFMAQPAAKVADAASFEEMRNHIANLYQGVGASHSYVSGASTYDCIATEQQPAMRKYGLASVAAPPPVSLLRSNDLATAGLANNDEVKPVAITSQHSSQQKTDPFGNAIGCTGNTIPFQRVTLETMSRFPTLRGFSQKGPAGSVALPGKPISPAIQNHKYAFTDQTVINFGGNSNINVWAPFVNDQVGQIFSLSQAWFYAGQNAGTQTAEVGWQVYPTLYGTQSAVLFIYFTADGYQYTGCYNNTCGDFVQISPFWELGGALGYSSTPGGEQDEVEAEYFLYGGNWWLALGGVWVGYYPGEVYLNGPMTYFATGIEYGTESVAAAGIRSPPEGSGYWPSAGLGFAAYQRNLFYLTSNGATVWNTLGKNVPSPTCYGVGGPYSSGGDGWGIYFLVGGPGGPAC